MENCYTCNSYGKHTFYKIQEDEYLTFSYDLKDRNMIIVTPLKHYHSISDFPNDELVYLFKSITMFCDSWKLETHQLVYNSGEWQNNHHFHIKIAIKEEKIIDMRRRHGINSRLKSKFY